MKEANKKVYVKAKNGITPPKKNLLLSSTLSIKIKPLEADSITTNDIS